MDSFTTQDSTYYSTAPFNWLTDTNLYNVTPNNLNPGLFLRNDNPTTNRIDQESTFVGLDNVIGKCETVDVTSLTLKGQVDQIVLMAGDADFVPAAKIDKLN